MDRDPFLNSPGIPVLNGTGEEVPPYGVVVLGVADDDGFRDISKPAEDNDPHVYVNGGATIQKDVKGRVHFLPMGPVAYDPEDGEPAINEEWGPKADEFLLRKGYSGFRCAGEADGFTAVFARIAPGDGAEVNVKITGALAGGYWPGVYTNRVVGSAVTYTDGAIAIKVVVLGGGSLENGKRYRGKLIGTVTVSSVDYPLVEVRGDADWVTKSGAAEVTWAGGLVSTTTQSFKGAKTFRDAAVKIASSLNTNGYTGATSYTGPITVIGYDGMVIQAQVSPDVGVTVYTLELGFYENDFVPGAYTALVTSMGSIAFKDGDAYVGSSRVFNLNWVNAYGTGSGTVLGRFGFLTSFGIGIPPDGWLPGVDDYIDVQFAAGNGINLVFAGGLYIGRDYGGPSPPPPPPPPPPATQGSVRVTAWHDANADGTWNVGELPAANRTVILSGPSGSVTSTDATGHCFFANLDPGNYLVAVYVDTTTESCAANSANVSVTAATMTAVYRPIVSTVPPAPAVGGIMATVRQYNGSTYSPLVRDVTLGGAASETRTGGSSYLFSNLAVASYTITVTPTGADTGTWAWTVDSPASSGSGTATGSFLIVVNQKSLVTLTHTPGGTTYSISGTVTVNGLPAARDIQLTGTSSDSLTSDGGTGFYEFTGLAAGTYTVTVDVLAGETSTPANYTGLVTPASHFGKNFVITS